MTIEDFITKLFCCVDDKLSLHGKNRKHSQTQGISIALPVRSLDGYGLIRVFKVDTSEGDIEYWATNDLQMDELVRLKYTE